MWRGFRQIGLVASLAMVSGSCALIRPARERAAPVDLPAEFSQESGAAPSTSRWWESFGSADLNALVEQALSSNFNVRRAWARLDQASELAIQAGADRWPALAFDASARRARSLVTGVNGEPAPKTADQFTLGLAAAYEVDLWGRVSSGVKAARLDLQASRDDLETAAISVAAEIAEAWFSAMLVAEIAMSVGASLTFVTVIVKTFSVERLPWSVERTRIE